MSLDIDTWLHGFGLAGYAELFRSNDIDAPLLRRLTERYGASTLTPPQRCSRTLAALLEQLSGLA